MDTLPNEGNATPKKGRGVLGVAGALFAPVLLMWAWLSLAGEANYQNTFGDILWYAVIPLGFVFTFLFPMRWYWRLGLFLVYFPFQFWMVFLFAISYACAVYRNCL